MKLSDLNTVQQSLLCQKEFHIRQVWLLQSKIALLEKYRKKKMNSTSEKEMGRYVGYDNNAHIYK